MATRTITVDDLSGKETLTAKPVTVTMSYTGKDEKGKDKEVTVSAEFDLSVDSVNALTEWIAEGDTRSMSMLIPRRTKVTPNGDSESEAVRAWAKAQPEFADKVKDKGRLPDDVTDAYKKAHQTPTENSETK